MRRTNFYVSEQQLAQLRAISDKTGISVAEIVRRAIDDYLAREASKEKERKKQ